MTILGIDPGLRVTGYGVIEARDARVSFVEAGVIRTNASDGIAARLGSIHAGVRDVIKDFRPGVLVVEKLFAHYNHPTTALLMGHVRGVVCLAAHEAGIELVSMPSTRVKKSVISRGHASKHQVQRAVQAILGLDHLPEPVDVADALAIALSYAMTKEQFRHRDATLRRLAALAEAR